MKPSRGFFSLIQFCPDASRLEVANLGVILFCPERHFLKARIAADNERVRKLFGKHDWQFINAQKRAIEERLKAAADQFHTLEDFRDYAGRRANQVIVTEPRFVKVFDPAADVRRLFEELVGEHKPRTTSPRAVTRFRKALNRARLEEAIRQDIEVPLHELGRTFSAPFGYRNGRFNLIAPQRFDLVDETESFDKACRLAIEGEHLRLVDDPDLGPLSLVVVGQFRKQAKKQRDAIKTVFKEHDVTLYGFDNVKPLLNDIRESVEAPLSYGT